MVLHPEKNISNSEHNSEDHKITGVPVDAQQQCTT